ncbi:MAG: tRNA uridine-5-carboxymethylaminomethyl(34) synthesis GTPase MnmE [Gemmatimonadota bacterium]
MADRPRTSKDQQQEGLTENRRILQVRDDTIAAIATAPGRSAIALIRLSGPRALVIASTVCHRLPGPDERPLLTALEAPDGSLIDDALVLRFDTPRSFTGEDVIEFSCHGGAAVSSALMDVLLHHGARLAEPGEFTQRAFINGKLDLIQAEAVAQIIDAPTQAARRIALSQLHGELSESIDSLRQQLLQLEALLAYDIDFPEEDDGPIPAGRILDAAVAVREELESMLATAPRAGILRDGARVVIAGEPNAGKSSLFNALLGERRALVTEIPGTTRDALEGRIETARWPIRLIDTAGLREVGEDLLEQMGIEVSFENIRDAQVVLACGETVASIDFTTSRLEAVTDVPVIRVRTKADLRPATQSHESDPVSTDENVSVRTRHGLDSLVERIEAALEKSALAGDLHGPLLTTARHGAALAAAAAEMREFERVWRERLIPAIVAAVHVRSASDLLGELIGSVSPDDVLGAVFATFCIGK